MIKIKNCKKFLMVFAISLFSIYTAQAQNTMGAKSLAMGQTGTAIPDSEWSLYSNASLIPSNGNRVSFYGFRYVGLSEISDISTVISMQSKIGTVAAGIHRYGFDLFNETRMLIAVKQSFEPLYAGFSISYYHISQGGSYGSAGGLGMHLGLAAKISEHVWLGARTTNINQPSYGRSEEMLPRELAIGISYEISETLLFTSDLVKDVLFPVSIRAGLEFELFRNLFARMGITTEPETYTFGFGYLVGSLQVNIGLQQHRFLGLSTAVDIGIQF